MVENVKVVKRYELCEEEEVFGRSEETSHPTLSAFVSHSDCSRGSQVKGTPHKSLFYFLLMSASFN